MSFRYLISSRTVCCYCIIFNNIILLLICCAMRYVDYLLYVFNLCAYLINLQQPVSCCYFSTADAIDYIWLHEIGTGIDDNPLPDHVSSDSEMLALVASVEAVLRTIPRPAAVTISRCEPH